MTRDEFFQNKVALYILDGLDLHSARLMAAEQTALVYYDMVDQAQYGKDWKEEREQGWSV